MTHSCSMHIAQSPPPPVCACANFEWVEKFSVRRFITVVAVRLPLALSLFNAYFRVNGECRWQAKHCSSWPDNRIDCIVLDAICSRAKPHPHLNPNPRQPPRTKRKANRAKMQITNKDGTKWKYTRITFVHSSSSIYIAITHTRTRSVPFTQLQTGCSSALVCGSCWTSKTTATTTDDDDDEWRWQHWWQKSKSVIDFMVFFHIYS